MTRKSPLQPIPDPPRSGVDLAELRRNLAPAAPAALQPVQTPATDTQAATDARSRLQRLRSAKQAAVEQLAGLDAVIVRAEGALTRTAAAQTVMVAIEDEAARATRAWIAAGARGDPPTLSTAQRTALEAARADFTSAARQAATVEQTLETLRADRSLLAAAIGQADVEIRQVALAVVAAGFDGLLDQYVTSATAALAAEQAARTLARFLKHHGYEGSSALFARISDVQPRAPKPTSYPTEQAAADARATGTTSIEFQPYAARLEKLLAGEEQP